MNEPFGLINTVKLELLQQLRELIAKDLLRVCMHYSACLIKGKK